MEMDTPWIAESATAAASLWDVFVSAFERNRQGRLAEQKNSAGNLTAQIHGESLVLSCP
jgi:hypothetical protein